MAQLNNIEDNIIEYASKWGHLLSAYLIYLKQDGWWFETRLRFNMCGVVFSLLKKMNCPSQKS